MGVLLKNHNYQGDYKMSTDLDAKMQALLENGSIEEEELSEEEFAWYLDPANYNKNNYQNGMRIKATINKETRNGFVAKQIDDRHFLVKLEYSFNKTNPGKGWLKVCRDYAHQSIKEIS